jgi:hypothetical protein
VLPDQASVDRDRTARSRTPSAGASSANGARSRAINLDANCGWARGKADVLYVADAFSVMRDVNRLLAAQTTDPSRSPGVDDTDLASPFLNVDN